MQVVTYARVSTQGQAEHGYSLNDQKALLAEHCRGRGYNHVEHIADEGISGRIEDRPGLQRIIVPTPYTETHTENRGGYV